MKLTKLATGRYQVRWRERGGTQRARNFRTRELAQDFLRQLMTGKGAEGKRESLTFAAFAERWHRDHCCVEKALTQQIDDPKTIRRYLIPAFGDKLLGELTKLDLLALRGRLKTEGRLRPKSINLITSLAKSMLTVAVDWDLLAANPFRDVKLLRHQEQPFDFWSVDERERFLNVCRRRDPAFAEVVELACHTGLRVGEISGLCRDSLDYDRRMIVVRRKFNRTAFTMEDETKSRRWREVPMNPVVYRLLLAHRLKLPTTRLYPLGIRHVARQLRRLATEAGVRPIKFHDLRHTFASHLAMAGLPLQKIQALLGHSDFRQTLRYAHLTPAALSGATDALCALNVHSDEEGSTNLRDNKGITWGHTDLNPARVSETSRTKTAQ